jgi:hypothetical protein
LQPILDGLSNFRQTPLSLVPLAYVYLPR